jgi:hypothetical protein
MWMMASPRRVVPEASVSVGEVGDVGDVGGWCWGPSFSDTNVSPVMVREGLMVRKSCDRRKAEQRVATTTTTTRVRIEDQERGDIERY